MSENLTSDRVILRNRQDSVNLKEAIVMYVSIIKKQKRETCRHTIPMLFSGYLSRGGLNARTETRSP
jgi:hypothetical protein